MNANEAEYAQQLAANMTKPRVLALDLSTAATGWVVGPAGAKPEFFGTIRPGLNEEAAKYPAAKLHLIAKACSAMFKHHKCHFAVAEELNSGVNMATTRFLAQLAGAVMAILWAEHRAQLYFISTPKARSAAGVDLGWHGTGERPDAKQRVADCLKLRGIKVSNGDEADAAIILIASRLLLPQNVRRAA